MISPWAKLLLFNNTTFFDQEMVKPHRSSQPGSLFDLNLRPRRLTHDIIKICQQKYQWNLNNVSVNDDCFWKKEDWNIQFLSDHNDW